jgi:Double-GTPase 2
VSGTFVVCPVCLSRLLWTELPRYRWDKTSFSYVELKIPGNASPEQAARAERGARIRCPDPSRSTGEHYLPVDYGRYGQPVVLGFVGASRSGKTHLLSAMIGEIEGGGLRTCGLTSRPIDEAMHHSFLAESVKPLLEDRKILPATAENIVSFADALLIGPAGGLERPVAFFDVAGGELGREQSSRDGAKSFLEVADGLVFVADPAELGRPARLGEDTFNTVLDLLRSARRLPEVSAAVVVNKADLLRYYNPVSLWLRSGMTGMNPELTLRESEDVFAYLDHRGAQSWTRPYEDCAKATLHVASATGGPAQAGESYLRTVTPRRVLTPLVALLAMTGVLPGDAARQVGV